MHTCKTNALLLISASTRLQLTLNPAKVLGMSFSWFHVGSFFDLHIKNGQHWFQLGIVWNMVERMTLRESRDSVWSFVSCCSMAVGCSFSLARSFVCSSFLRTRTSCPRCWGCSGKWKNCPRVLTS